MDVIIKPSVISGRVKAIASKSYAHRLLILSALSDRITFIECAESSEDIDATVSCLISLGAEIGKTDGGFSVTPVRTITKNNIFDCGESGSTLRFMLPVACALGAEPVFLGRGRLPERPMTQLYRELAAHGCFFPSAGVFPLRCKGRLTGGRFSLPGDVSSQFITGLLLALPLLEEDSVIELYGDIESENYIAMTLSALLKFGVGIGFDAGRFYIKSSEYISPGELSVEGDWSNAAFWLCAAVISRSAVTCSGLDMNSVQGDRAIISVLSDFGANIECSGNSVAVYPSELHGTEIDARQIPDLIPVLSAVASIAHGKTIIKNAARLRLKESDRLSSVTKSLTALGAGIAETEDGLVISGRGRLSGGITDSFGDHRIAMTAAVASAACDNPVIIKNAHAVNKSYPGFFSDFAALGGRFETTETDT
jgi:3-phosphoshikimate 1-carboxyvinyltransferase